MSFAPRDPDVEVELRLLSTEDGGRRTPAASGYAPNHLVQPDYLTSGRIDFIGRDSLHPGEASLARIAYLAPEAYPGCMWVGRVVNVQEGGRIVGYATVTKVLNPVLEAPAN